VTPKLRDTASAYYDRSNEDHLRRTQLRGTRPGARRRPADRAAHLRPFANTLIGPGEPIILPPETKHVDAEAELCVEIGTAGHRIPEARALEHVRGYRCANDVSARNIQYSESQWTRAKGFDTFCPLGEPRTPGAKLEEMTVVTRVNGTERQRGKVADMVFSIPTVLAYISQVMTLEAGDLVLTGTPAGVGILKAGDEVEVEILGVSRVKSSVIASDSTN
jgi:2-keto-4-pentenoate hydratase/2-oxohepta-3-ene-1,7-dioic acid hydratase in catechol pathway